MRHVLVKPIGCDGLLLDQRGVGFPRDNGSGVDIGADEVQLPWFTLTVNAGGLYSGQVLSSPAGIDVSYPVGNSDSLVFSEGSLISLTAQSAVGGVASWVCTDGVASGNDTSVASCALSNLTADAMVAVTFTPTYVVTSTAPASEGGFSPESQTVIHGGVASFTVTAEPGYTIESVTGCGGNWTGSNPYQTGAITAACEVAATFTLNTYTVSASAPVDQGYFDLVSQIIDYNQTAEFNVTAETGYAIVSVEGCGGQWTGSNPYVTAAITADCEVVASFTLDTFLVDTLLESPDQGDISPTFVQAVTYGTTTSFDITPVEGYEIESVSGCSGVWTGENPYVTGEVTEACTVTVSFIEQAEECSFFTIPLRNGAVVILCL